MNENTHTHEITLGSFLTASVLGASGARLGLRVPMPLL